MTQSPSLDTNKGVWVRACPAAAAVRALCAIAVAQCRAVTAAEDGGDTVRCDDQVERSVSGPGGRTRSRRSAGGAWCSQCMKASGWLYAG